MAYRIEGSAVIGIPDPSPVGLSDPGQSTWNKLEAQALGTQGTK